MDRRIRYEMLNTEEDDDSRSPLIANAEPLSLEHADNVQAVATDTPQEEGAVANSQEQQQEAVKNDPFLPPSYNIATTLPSYEEAERTKEEEETVRNQQNTVENGEARGIDRLTEMQLGTDGMFLCMFLIAFVFNWVGLLASLCIDHTVAGRFGAISGFGLSMVKWVIIVKHNNWAAGMAESDSWLWWLLVILGFVLFFRGCTQYIRLKYQWHRLSTHVRNQVYFMF